MAGYFIENHRGLRTRKSLLIKISSPEFNTMSLNSNFSKVVSHIQDNKSWEWIYVLLKIISLCLWVFLLADSNKAMMDKVFYYSRMTKISIIKSSYDLDNNEVLSISKSSYLKVWSSSDSDTEEEDNIDIEYLDSID